MTGISDTVSKVLVLDISRPGLHADGFTTNLEAACYLVRRAMCRDDSKERRSTARICLEEAIKHMDEDGS